MLKIATQKQMFCCNADHRSTTSYQIASTLHKDNNHPLVFLPHSLRTEERNGPAVCILLSQSFSSSVDPGWLRTIPARKEVILSNKANKRDPTPENSALWRRTWLIVMRPFRSRMAGLVHIQSEDNGWQRRISMTVLFS